MRNIHKWHLTKVSSTMQMIFYWDLGKKVIDRFVFEKLIEYTCFFIKVYPLRIPNQLTVNLVTVFSGNSRNSSSCARHMLY